MAEERLAHSSAGARKLLGLCAVILTIILASVQVGLIAQSNGLRHQLDRSYARELQLEQLLSLHQDVESGQRGFAITGNPVFLEPYSRARSQIGPAFAALRADPGTLDVHALEVLSAPKIKISAAVIATRWASGQNAAMAIISSGRGKIAMDIFRAQVAVAKEKEKKNRDVLISSFALANLRSQLWIAAIEGVLLGLLLTAVVAYWRNMTRLQRATDHASDLSSRQVAIFDAATDAMLLANSTGFVESVNPAMGTLFRLDEAEMLGKSVQELFEGEIHITGFNERRSKRRNEDVIRNVAAVCGDNSRFEAEIAVSTVHLADGVRTLLLVRDSTERNRLERIKDEFVSTVSHELRTPLTSIGGALSLLNHSIGSSLEERPAQLLKIAVANAGRLTLLVDDILDIERINSDRFDLNLETIDLRDVVAAAEEQNQTFATNRNVTLVVTKPDEPLMVRGDASRLIQALANLISNAAKFSPERGTVSMIAERVDRIARVSVADRGPGIPLELQPRLFGRFAQATSQSSARCGTGLGLAITKAIVEKHKGTIHYETDVRSGTRFWIELPAIMGAN